MNGLSGQKESCLPLGIFTLFAGSILLVSFFWFISGERPLELESPARIILGSPVIFILPGLVWGEILGFSADHFLEAVAISFALTLVIEIMLLPFPFLLAAGIRLWVSLLLVACCLGLVMVNVKWKSGRDLRFIKALVDFRGKERSLIISTLAIILVLALTAYGTYRWGEKLTDISGEKLLHMIFVRYYFSMRMVLDNLGISPGAPPPNLVNLWEYLMAGWASLVNIDPLYLFFRARFVIPVLGLSGMYLLVRNLFSNKTKSEIVFWGVLIMCLGWFALLSPSSLDWIKRSDQFRGTMAFMGSVHHADSAMEILLALGMGLILRVFRDISWKNILLLAGFLFAAFMWHPREFFQLAIYGGIFGIAFILFPGTRRRLAFKKWVYVMSAFLIVAIFFGFLSTGKISNKVEGYDELALKKIAVKYAFLPENILGIRNLFNFPFHMTLSSSRNPAGVIKKAELSEYFRRDWNFNLWLILSASVMPLLVVFGENEDRKFVLFYFLLWFIALCWNFSMLMLIVLTYSEIHITTPRMLYLFSYIVISDGLYVLSRVVRPGSSSRLNIVLFPSIMLVFGIVIHFWWVGGLPFARLGSWILNVVVIFSVILIFLPRILSRFSCKSAPPMVSTLVGMLLFFLPVAKSSYASVFSKLLTGKRPTIEWFSDRNPLGLSEKLIQYVRSLPPEHTFLVNPLGKACISIYAPQYLAVIPKIIGTVIKDREAYRNVRMGRDPIFTPPVDKYRNKILHGHITLKPLYEDNFAIHECDSRIAGGGDPIMGGAFLCLGIRGNFDFKCIREGNANVVRVVPLSRNKRGEMCIQFGYVLGKKPVKLTLDGTGRNVILLITARIGGNANTATVFIQDKTTNWERARSVIRGSTWKNFVVSKRIRKGAKEVDLGVYWEPGSGDDWLEIKEVRIYALNDGDMNVDFDRSQVNSWLKRYKADYLLLQEEFYTCFLPHFRRYPADYRVVFDNKRHRESVIRFLHR